MRSNVIIFDVTLYEEFQFVTLSMLITFFIQIGIFVPDEHRLADLASSPLGIIIRQNREVFSFCFRVFLFFAVLIDRRVLVCVTVFEYSQFFPPTGFADVRTITRSRTVAFEFIDESGRVFIINFVFSFFQLSILYILLSFIQG